MIHEIFSLFGKKVIVTGASGGIGLACAKAVAAFGARVVLAARNVEKLARTQEELQGEITAGAEFVSFNFDDLAQLAEFFARHADADVLINSIGTNIPKPMLEITEQDYDTLMQANVKNAFFQTQYFARSVQKPASIIHISSQMGHIGGLERSIYCASKHALEGLCKAAALELGQRDIRINTICPTFIETELTRSTLADPAKREHILRSIVLNRLGRLDDLYGAVVYLASDASSLVTGSSLKVDGGWTAH